MPTVEDWTTALDGPTGVAPAVALVVKARGVFERRYGASRYPHLSWAHAVWDLRPAKRTEQEKDIRKSFFTRRTPGRRAGAGGAPMPPGFADVAKAWLVAADVSPASTSRYANATRYLWDAVAARRPFAENGEPAFAISDWGSVEEDHFLDAELLAAAAGEHAEKHSKANVAHILKQFARWLADNRVCPGLEYVPGVRKRNAPQHASQEGRRSRLDRLPTRTAIEGLGKLYWHISEAERTGQTVGPRERLLIRAAGLLVLGGFRVSELCSLPYDCLRHEPHKGRERYYLRYWNRKTRRREAQWGRRWLSPLGAELAQRLVAEIKELTRDAREQAKRLEDDPKRLPVALPVRVTIDNWADVLGLTRDGLLAVLRADAQRPVGERRYPFYQPVGKGRKLFFERHDIERSLMKRRGALTVYDPENGDEPQRLSQTLFVFPAGLMTTARPQASPVLVDALTPNAFTWWLCGKARSGRGKKDLPSVFGRYGIVEPHGGDVKIRPHMPRHWLNTVANKAGMTAFQITLWMGRADWVQTLFYLHDHGDLADLVKEGIEDGTITGPAADVWARMSEAERPGFLDAIEQAHKTALGWCTASECECAREKVCEACAHALRTQGDAAERAARRERRAHAALAQDTYAKLAEAGHPVHPRLAELAGEMVEVLDAIQTSEPDASETEGGVAATT